MKVVVVCEGKAEAGLRGNLGEFLHRRVSGPERVGVKMLQMKGHIGQPDLQNVVLRNLDDPEVLGVVILTDVYKNYNDAQHAISSVSAWVGDAAKDQRVRIHAAQYDFEAWLLPFWNRIAKKLGVKNMKAPAGRPEGVNTDKPPSAHFAALYRAARREYQRHREAAIWLTPDALEESSRDCDGLRNFLNSLLEFAGAPLLS